ncbi:uncharacterized protein LOC144166476 [Haemaphysalis longicornis]
MALIASTRKKPAPTTANAKSKEDQLQCKLTEELMEQIKKGVHLRPTRPLPDEEQDEESSPEPAVNEVLNILVQLLGTQGGIPRSSPPVPGGSSCNCGDERQEFRKALSRSRKQHSLQDFRQRAALQMLKPYVTPAFSHLLVWMQGRKAKGRRWSKEIKVFALSLYFNWPKAYRRIP